MSPECSLPSFLEHDDVNEDPGMIFFLANDATLHLGCGLQHSPVPQGILSYIPVGPYRVKEC